MKRLSAVILILSLVLFTCAATAYASAKVDLPALKMSLEIPDEWVYVTRDTKANDPAYVTLYTDKAAMVQRLIETNTFLYARKIKGLEEIQVMMYEDSGDIFDLNLMSDAELDGSLQSIGSFTGYNDVSADLDMSGYSWSRIGQAAYIIFDMNDGSNYFKVYLTVINGMEICIFFREYSPLSPEQENILKGVVESIVFTEVLEKPDTDSTGTSAPPGSNTSFGARLGYALGSLLVVAAIVYNIAAFIRKRTGKGREAQQEGRAFAMLRGADNASEGSSAPGAEPGAGLNENAPGQAGSAAAPPAGPVPEGAYSIADIQIPDSNSLKCPACGNIQPKNRNRCFYCGARFVK